MKDPKIGKLPKHLQTEASNYLQITQSLVLEKIDWSFCEKVYDNMANGLNAMESLIATLDEFGFHMNDSALVQFSAINGTAPVSKTKVN